MYCSTGQLLPVTLVIVSTVQISRKMKTEFVYFRYSSISPLWYPLTRQWTLLSSWLICLSASTSIGDDSLCILLLLGSLMSSHGWVGAYPSFTKNTTHTETSCMQGPFTYRAIQCLQFTWMHIYGRSKETGALKVKTMQTTYRMYSVHTNCGSYLRPSYYKETELPTYRSMHSFCNKDGF